MSERDDYPAGVPCWVDTLQADVNAALDFYGQLFGWTFDGPGPLPGGLPGQYFVAQLKGREVAGIGSLPGGSEGQAIASWNTYVKVDSVDAAAAGAGGAGGTVLLAPFDASPAGRGAVLADPTGAPICVWEAELRAGAQLVNEPDAWMMSSLHSPDPDRAAPFYGALFGWEREAFGAVTLWRRPGYVGGVEGQPIPRDTVAVGAPADGSVPPHWNVNFAVADTDAFAAKASALGARLLMEPTDLPTGFRSAVIADPQGAAFSVNGRPAA
jgi:predicted enzyme related to lactoylglutathione lyase